MVTILIVFIEFIGFDKLTFKNSVKNALIMVLNMFAQQLTQFSNVRLNSWLNFWGYNFFRKFSESKNSGTKNYGNRSGRLVMGSILHPLRFSTILPKTKITVLEIIF